MMDDQTPESKTQTICLAILAVLAVMYAVYWLRPVLVPFVVSVFVVSGVGPILSSLERSLGVGRIVAAGITLVVGTIVLIAFGFAVWNSVYQLKQNATAYRDNIENVVENVEKRIPFLKLKSQWAPGPASPSVATGGTQTEISKSVDGFVRDGIAQVIEELLTLASSSVVVLIYVFFLLIGTPSRRTSPTVMEIIREVRTYLRVKTILSAVTGVAFGFALWLFGVPMAFAFGVMAFLLNFVPNVGPLFATLLPIPLIIFAPEAGSGWMIGCITVISLIQMISGNVVEPKVMGDSSDLHPVTILLALMFWGMMWGMIGMFLATPITSVMKLMLDRSDSTRQFANVMAGRWEDEATDEG